MAAFSSSGFDADDYFKSRPRYTAKIFDIVYAWHERSASGGSKGTADVSWKNAVDVGVGPGQLAYPLQARFQHVTGIDPSAKMLEQARSLDAPTALEIQPPPSNHTISFQEGTAEHTGLADHSTDIVTGGVTAHWLDWYSEKDGERVWREMARVIRPRGTVAFLGYFSAYVRGMQRMDEEIINSMMNLDRLGHFFDTSNPRSPYMIGMSCYDLIPKPTGPKWDESVLLKFDIDPKLTATSTPEPIPSWVGEALGVGVDTSSIPTLLSIRRPLYYKIGLIRSTSAYIKYLDKYPEQKILVEQDKDAAYQWLEEARWKQARSDAAHKLGSKEDEITDEEAIQHLIPWDQEVELYFPFMMLLARRSDQ